MLFFITWERMTLNLGRSFSEARIHLLRMDYLITSMCTPHCEIRMRLIQLLLICKRMLLETI
jgi:hypothetical protein